MGFWVFFTDDKVEYYDSDACELYLSPGRTVAIESNSKIIFDFLVMNRNAAMSRDQIISRIDGSEEIQNINNKFADRSPVDQAIRELRKKLDKYAGCVKTVRGIGYKYVGPPSVEKEPLNSRSHPTFPNTSSANSAPVSVDTAIPKKTSTVHSDVRSSRVVANLEGSLKRLVEAGDTTQINEARFRIKCAVSDYVDEVSLNYSANIKEDEDGVGWALEAWHHKRWLRRTIAYCRAEVESIDQDAELLEIKLEVLDYIYELYIVIELLGAQLLSEREALELSGRKIGKESRQSRISRVYREYRFAVADASLIDISIDEKISEYNRGRMADQPSI